MAVYAFVEKLAKYSLGHGPADFHCTDSVETRPFTLRKKVVK